jgi:hypothetical protein
MNRDLFDQEEHARPAEYRHAIEAWLTTSAALGRLRQDSSAEMYEHMWSAWTAWAVGRGLKLDAIRANDLDAYLQSRGGNTELSSRYAWRFLRLVDRVLAHRSSQLGADTCTAAQDLMNMRPEIRFANAADADPLPEFLSVAEAKDVVTYLSAVRPGRTSEALAWQEVRNRGAVGLMLGAGLTPGEVRALRIDDVVVDGGGAKGVPWKLRIAGNGNSPAPRNARGCLVRPIAEALDADSRRAGNSRSHDVSIDQIDWQAVGKGRPIQRREGCTAGGGDP